MHMRAQNICVIYTKMYGACEVTTREKKHLVRQSIDKKIVMQSRDRSVPSGGFRRHFVLDVFVDLLTCLHNFI